VRAQIVSLVLFVAACKAPPPLPVEPAWGKQTCAQCGAPLLEPQPSAQAWLADESRKFFDDVGCLADWLNRSSEKPEAAWVHSPAGDGWVDAYKAHYEGGHKTPMGYGFVPAESGLSFRELRIVAREKPKLAPAQAAP
jgi:nitrous oxide reductase accessory protein NosL